jgi:hypothetical protein
MVEVGTPWEDTSPSTCTLLPSTFVGQAFRCNGPLIGVGLKKRTVYSAVTVPGGRASPLVFINVYAAVQLPWQSSNTDRIPPLAKSENEAW